MRFKLAIVMCLVLNAGGVVAGEATATSKHVPKIGVVRIQALFKGYKYAKDQQESIKNEFQKVEKELNALKKQMDDKMKALRDDALIRPRSTRWQLEMLEIQRLKIEYEDKVEKFKKSARKREAEFWRGVYMYFRRAVKEYGDHYGYDLIITAPDTELSPETTDSPVAIQNEILLRRVQYIGKTVDLTDPILTHMNNKYDKWKKSGGDSEL